MCCETGVHEEAFFAIPLFNPTVVEQLQVVLNNEGDDVILQTLLKEDQAAYTAVSILEGMDALKGHMEGHDILKGLRGQLVIPRQQLANLIGNILRQCGIVTAYLIGQLLVLPYCKPILAAVAGASLQYEIQFLDEFLSQCRASLVDHHIDAPEVVGRLNHIIHIDCFIFKTDGVCLKDIASLIMRQTATFNMV